MRQQPTKAEQGAEKALAEAFKKEGHSVYLPERETKDKPDILIEIAGVRIACECTQIPPSYIYQYQHKRASGKDWQGQDLICESWPIEPHMWIADAIEKKARLVPDYLNRTSAKEPWLLIHSPPESNQSLVAYDKEWFLRALRHGALMNNHPFRQIYLWTPQGGIHKVYAQDQDSGLNSELGIGFGDGYPTLNVVKGSLSFTTPDSTHPGPYFRNANLSSKALKVVPPKDPTYAKHQGAGRDVSYKFRVYAWSDHAEIKIKIIFADSKKECIRQTKRLDNLSSNQTYWFHFLHEFCAPKRLETMHVV